MIRLVLMLTLRQLLGQKRTLFLGAVALLPLVAAIIHRAANSDAVAAEFAAEFAAEVVLYGLIVTALLPLTAVLLATAAIGNEIEDGTIVYLLSKPAERWRILAGSCLPPGEQRLRSCSGAQWWAAPWRWRGRTTGGSSGGS